MVQHKFFIIPVMDSETQEADLNRFLGNVRLIHLTKEFVDAGRDSFWAVAVEYLENKAGPQGGKTSGSGKKRIDYKEVLKPEEFALFARLRDWRKNAAAKEGVPVYTLFTNEQLATIVTIGVRTLPDLQAVDGVGEARVEKWGRGVLKILGDDLHAAPGGEGRGQEE